MALTDNITHYYKLDESSGDASDSVGTLTLTNTSTTYGTGLINNGAIFSTTGHYLHTGTDLFSGSTFSNFTVNFWVKITSAPTSGQSYALMYNQSTDQFGFDYSNNDDVAGKIVLFFTLTTDGSALSYETTLTTDTWYMITLQWDGSSKYIFLNTSNVASNAASSWTDSGNNLGFTIGNTSSGTRPGGFDIDEVGVWTRVLSGTELTSLYNSGAGLQYPFTAPTVNSGFLMFI